MIVFFFRGKLYAQDLHTTEMTVQFVLIFDHFSHKKNLNANLKTYCTFKGENLTPPSKSALEVHTYSLTTHGY